MIIKTLTVIFGCATFCFVDKRTSAKYLYETQTNLCSWIVSSLCLVSFIFLSFSCFQLNHFTFTSFFEIWLVKLQVVSRNVNCDTIMMFVSLSAVAVSRGVRNQRVVLMWYRNNGETCSRRWRKKELPVWNYRLNWIGFGKKCRLLKWKVSVWCASFKRLLKVSQRGSSQLLDSLVIPSLLLKGSMLTDRDLQSKFCFFWVWTC